MQVFFAGEQKIFLPDVISGTTPGLLDNPVDATSNGHAGQRYDREPLVYGGAAAGPAALV